MKIRDASLTIVITIGFILENNPINDSSEMQHFRLFRRSRTRRWDWHHRRFIEFVAVALLLLLWMKVVTCYMSFNLWMLIDFSIIIIFFSHLNTFYIRTYRQVAYLKFETRATAKPLLSNNNLAIYTPTNRSLEIVAFIWAAWIDVVVKWETDWNPFGLNTDSSACWEYYQQIEKYSVNTAHKHSQTPNTHTIICNYQNYIDLNDLHIFVSLIITFLFLNAKQ